MTENQKNQSENGGKPYLSAFGAWALAFGCAVGWGAFVMPGTTFLPIAGPVGTVVGLGLGALIMVVIARNYHYLINRYPGTGGTYSFTKKCFGYDQGFLAAWFMILTYFAIIWANATALPLIARTLLPGVFQFGFHYEVAGFHVYFGEVLLVVLALAAGALVCLRRRLDMWTQIFMAVLLFCGAIGCFAAAVWNGADAGTLEPAFSPDHAPAAGVVIVFALAPWAYVGFESISHSSGESKYKLKKSFTVMACALAAAAAVYAVLSLSAVLHAPDGNGWTAYVANLGTYSGVESMPVFYSIYASLGKAGSVILGTVA
ncbi:MAG: APC family permease, partial [Clostridia bacterium]|nr:APC family permease [Clostridia bacterium]